nr:hypothetical protein [Tanacetum cinerariifolium]
RRWRQRRDGARRLPHRGQHAARLCGGRSPPKRENGRALLGWADKPKHRLPQWPAKTGGYYQRPAGARPAHDLARCQLYSAAARLAVPVDPSVVAREGIVQFVDKSVKINPMLAKKLAQADSLAQAGAIGYDITAQITINDDTPFTFVVDPGTNDPASNNVARNAMNFNVLIKVTDQLSKPTIGFDITVPQSELNNPVGGQVDAVLGNLRQPSQTSELSKQ